ncbi:MAG: hypothetical protein M0Z99_01410 [Betaproteobacteria bacterium]|nr:hypothetical protein [Betaproteobacteria bacterium]
MENHPQNSAPLPPNLGEMFRSLRRRIRLRWVLIAGALLAIIAGVALNWSALVVAGLAPLVLVLVPCAAMCAIHLCMKRGQSGDAGDSRPPAEKPGGQ